jgi:rSAM/selenodomain-associated transferase 1
MEKPEQSLDNIALIVFTKTLDSPVKMRIARTEGKEVADRIYGELLKATAETIKGLPYYVAFAGGRVPGGLTAIFSNAVAFFPQTGNNLGVRMKNACLHCQGLGFARCIVIGCDCPGRTADDILQASQAMRQGCNVVLGPVIDGGYHLAGVDIKGLEIFKATAWSTTNLMKETLMIIEKRNLRFSLLPMRRDIDTFKDYWCWKSGDSLFLMPFRLT